jgi:hypothetical protein
VQTAEEALGNMGWIAEPGCTAAITHIDAYEFLVRERKEPKESFSRDAVA